MTNLAENKVNKLDTECLCCVPSGAIRDASKPPRAQPARIRATRGKTALSRGERVACDGVFISRLGSGEGLLPSGILVVVPNVRISDVPPSTLLRRIEF